MLYLVICAITSIFTEKEVCPSNILLENEDSFHLDVDSFEIIYITGSYLKGNALSGDNHFSHDQSYHALINSKSKRKSGPVR